MEKRMEEKKNDKKAKLSDKKIDKKNLRLVQGTQETRYDPQWPQWDHITIIDEVNRIAKSYDLKDGKLTICDFSGLCDYSEFV